MVKPVKMNHCVFVSRMTSVNDFGQPIQLKSKYHILDYHPDSPVQLYWSRMQPVLQLLYIGVPFECTVRVL